MSKRQLTGGTGDLKPQIFSIQATQTAADTFTTVTFRTPVPHMPTANKATVMEILQVYLDDFLASQEVDSFVGVILQSGSATPNSSFTVAIADPRVIAFMDYRLSAVGSPTALLERAFPRVMDLSDGAGNGILLATDTLTLAIYSSSTSVAHVVTAKLIYRMTNVSMMEYVGIVQSQQ